MVMIGDRFPSYYPQYPAVIKHKCHDHILHQIIQVMKNMQEMLTYLGYLKKISIFFFIFEGYVLLHLLL
jgi:hypothetical protein